MFAKLNNTCLKKLMFLQKKILEDMNNTVYIKTFA